MLRIITAIIAIFVFVEQVGDGFIVKDEEPLVICEMGDVFIRDGK